MRKRKQYILIILFLIVGLCKVSAQSNLHNSIDRLINESLTQLKGIPSISIAIVKCDSIILIKSEGVADVKNNVMATTKTPYYIASATKSFTGTLAQILSSEGVIDLDTPIVNYKPIREFEDKRIFQDITIRQLLTHTSGITNGYLVWRNATSGEYTDDKLIEILRTHTSSLDNNKSFKYDNLGYNIFSLILKEEFSLDWKSLLEQKLFSPLNMTHTTAYYAKVIGYNWPVTKPYIVIGKEGMPNEVKTNKDEKTMQAAGGLYSSIEDISKWLLFNINKGVYNDEIIYPKTVMEEVCLRHVEVNKKGAIFKENGYCLGWHDATFDNKRVLYHNGGFLGHSAKVAFMPEEKIGVAVFVNESFYGDNIADMLTHYTFNYFLNNEDTLDTYYEEIASIKEKVKRMNRKYASILLERESRISPLSLDVSEYIGNYANEGFGVISLKLNQGKILFEMGILEAIVSYGTEKDTLEVELLGPASNSKIEFSLNGEKVESLRYKGLDFRKQK